MMSGFAYGGARVFVGTCTSVLDSIACEFATGLVDTQLSIGEYVHKFNSEYFKNSPLFCYAMSGLPTQKLDVLDDHNDQWYLYQVKLNLGRLQAHRDANPFQSMRDKIDWTIGRLQSEISRLSTQD